MNEKIYSAIDLMVGVNKPLNSTKSRKGIFLFTRKEGNIAQIQWHTSGNKAGVGICTKLSPDAAKTTGVDVSWGAKKLDFGSSDSNSLRTANVILYFLYDDPKIVEALNIPFCHRFIKTAKDRDPLTASSIYMWASGFTGMALAARVLEADSPDVGSGETVATAGGETSSSDHLKCENEDSFFAVPR